MFPGGIAEVLIPLAGMVTGGVVVVTLGRLIRHWVDRHYDSSGPGAGEEVRDQVTRLRQEVEGVRALEDRVAELEERLDFAERVLARAPKELPGSEAR